MDAVLLGHVDHVEADHQRHVQRQQLRDQVEAALQRSRVDQRDHDVGALGDQVVAGDALLLRVGGQAVGSGQVDEVDRSCLVVEHAGFLLHRLAGPVAHVLVQPGQHVEHGGLAHVRLADQGDGQRVRRGGHARAAIVTDRLDKAQIRAAWPRFTLGTEGRASHGCCHQASLGRTRMHAASARPSATSVPRSATTMGPRP